MRAGELKHRITIQSKGTPTRDEMGQEVIPWPTFAIVWAAKEPLSGREYEAGQQLDAAIDVRYRIRYLAGVTSNMRIVDGSETYEIVSPPIDIKGIRREMHLMCQEVL